MNKLIALLVSTAFVSGVAFAANTNSADNNQAQNTVVAPAPVQEKDAKLDSQKEAKLDVQNAFVSLPAAGSKNAALFFTVKNSSGKDITIVDVAADVANKTELHDTKKDDKGVVAMNKIDNIKVANGQTVELKSGGLHVMLLDLKKDLKEGDKVDFSINTKEAGVQKVSAVVAKK